MIKSYSQSHTNSVGQVNSLGLDEKGGGYITLLFFVSAICDSLAALLERQDFFEAFRNEKGMEIIERLLQAPFQCPAYTLSALSCFSFPSLFPKTLDPVFLCLERLETADSTFYLNWVFEKISANLLLLQRSLLQYKTKYGDDSWSGDKQIVQQAISKGISAFSALRHADERVSKDSPLWAFIGFLDSVECISLSDILARDGNNLNPRYLAFTDILAYIMTIGLLIGQAKNLIDQQTPEDTEKFFLESSNGSNMQVLNALINIIEVGSLREITHGNHRRKEAYSEVQPVYQLLVMSELPITVRSLPGPGKSKKVNFILYHRNTYCLPIRTNC